MTTTLRSSITAEIGWTWRDQVGTSLITDSNRLRHHKDLSDGAEVDEADAVWHVEDQALVAGESTTVELDGLEQSRFGDTITIPLSKVKSVMIVNKNTSGGGYLLVGAAAADEWYAPFGASGDTVKVMPDGSLFLNSLRDGWDVEADSAALKIAAVGADVTYDVAVLGTLASGSGPSSSSSGA